MIQFKSKQIIMTIIIIIIIIIIIFSTYITQVYMHMYI